MSNSNLVSLKDLKDEWKIDFNKSKKEIDMIFHSEYKEYTERPSDYSGENFNVDKLKNICQSIEPQYIPYSSLTDIIFSMDIELDKDEEMETDFVTVIQSKVNDYILQTYKTEDIDLSIGASQFDEITNETRAIIEIDKIEDEEKNSIIVMHKIIEHINLAISQKRGLYEKQKQEISGLSKSIEDFKDKADNNLKEVEQRYKEINDKQSDMISQYISILGIFAAILMTAFGGIQSFTAIYKNNSFSLVDSLLIACIGFLGILLMLFLLLNSIAKLSNKNLDSGNSKNRWYLRHPTFVNSFIILSTLALICVTYKMSVNPPNFSWWGVLYLIPIIYILIMVKIFDNYTIIQFFKDLIRTKEKS